MRFSHALLALAASASTVAADFRVNIPEVESAVELVLSKFAANVHYHGPTGTATHAAATYRPRPGPPTATAGSYWLENIKHQGVAAFNPDMTYQVFRNVKDFGAKGSLQHSVIRDSMRYNIFSFFNQRFLIELFYNKYIKCG